MKGVVGPASTWHGKARSLEASAGTASYPVDGVAADEVLLAADRALFVAKRCRRRPGRGAVGGRRALAGEFKLQAPTPIDALESPAA